MTRIQTDKQTKKQINNDPTTNKITDRQTDKDRQTIKHRQTDRQMDSDTRNPNTKVLSHALSQQAEWADFKNNFSDVFLRKESSDFKAKSSDKQNCPI